MKRLIAPLVALVALFGMGGRRILKTAVNTATTPGAADGAATQQTVSASRLRGKQHRHVGGEKRQSVFAASYRIKRESYAVSTSINQLLCRSACGGTHDSTKLWPQLRNQARSRRRLRKPQCLASWFAVARSTSVRCNKRFRATGRSHSRQRDCYCAEGYDRVRGSAEASAASSHRSVRSPRWSKPSGGGRTGTADAAAARQRAEQQAQQQQQSVRTAPT